MLKFVILAVAICSLSAFPSFRNKIPNGHKVPSPCNQDIWEGVGHMNTHGGGSRNPFGRAFDAAGKTWTKELCSEDSDSDGVTNGAELGDPDCKWLPGSTPTGPANSHPGICEPTTSEHCKERNSWLECAAKGHFCPSLKNNTNVKVFELRMNANSHVPMPPNETNYFCQRFSLPNDDHYELIAFEGLIDHPDYYHHADVRACPPSQDSTVNEPKYSEPRDCKMSLFSAACILPVGFYSVGFGGWCLEKDVSIPFGKDGFSTVQLMVHWHNPEKRTNIVDRSGIKIYYQKRERKNVQATLTMESKHIVIPPGVADTTVDVKLESSCSSQILKEGVDYRLGPVFQNMHILGRSTSLLITRKNGTVETVLDGKFDYTQPDPKLEKPVHLRAGDAIEWKCHYDSTQRKNYTFFGLGVREEVCLVALGITPPFEDAAGKPVLMQWVQNYAGDNTCKWRLPKTECDLKMLNFTAAHVLKEACGSHDYDPNPETCHPACLKALAHTRMLNHPCLKGSIVHRAITYNFALLGKDINTPLVQSVAPMIETCTEHANALLLEDALESGEHLEDDACEKALSRISQTLAEVSEEMKISVGAPIEIPYCSDYRGKDLTKTRKGDTCQAWDAYKTENVVHKMSNRVTEIVATWDETQGNYCRDPDGAKKNLWCYTTNPEVRWGWCANTDDKFCKSG